MELSQFDAQIDGIIKARETIKAIGEALQKVVQFRRTHHTWKRLLSAMGSISDIGVTDRKVLKLLESHEELSTIGSQLRFLAEFAGVAVAKYGEPD
jgi:hypothetical protein